MSLNNYIRQRLLLNLVGLQIIIMSPHSSTTAVCAIWDCHWRPLISYCSRMHQCEQWLTCLAMPTWFPSFTSHIGCLYVCFWVKFQVLVIIYKDLHGTGPYYLRDYLPSFWAVWVDKANIVWAPSIKHCYLLGLRNFLCCILMYTTPSYTQLN